MYLPEEFFSGEIAASAGTSRQSITITVVKQVIFGYAGPHGFEEINHRIQGILQTLCPLSMSVHCMKVGLQYDSPPGSTGNG